MIAALVVLAMINLWDVDASAAQPAAAQFEQRLAGLGNASDAHLDSSTAPGPIPLNVCTYGAPPLGRQLFSDATNLARTFSTPACADSTSGFQSGFGAQSLYDFLPLGMVLPWRPAFAPGVPVTLPEHAATSPSRSGPVLSSGLPAFSNVHLPADVRESWSARPASRSEARSQIRHH